jgi:S1-C subfamily serine protease
MEGSIAARGKRRPISPVVDRPAKHLKQDDVEMSDGDVTPENGLLNGAESDMEDSLALPVAKMTADTAEWQATIESVVKNVVSIRFCQTCSFDTDSAVSSEATGFVVDAEKGYILTNRHVVGAGPFWGYCIFDNHEEASFGRAQLRGQLTDGLQCDVYPVYRDPVHDFGFLKFDPKAIKYMPVASLNLRPDLARKLVYNPTRQMLSTSRGRL